MHTLRHVSFCAIISVLITMIAGEAEAKRRNFGIPLFIFGQSDEIICLQEVALVGEDGEALCLSEYNVYNFFFAGVTTTSELVLGEKNGHVYYELPTDLKLKSLQDEGLLPNPLPTYSRPILDYLYGYSLWILLAVIACIYLLVKMVGGRDRTPSGLHKQEMIFASNLRRVLVAAMLSDGSIDEEEKNTIKSVYKQITGADMSDTELETVIEALMNEHEPVKKALEQTSENLTDDGKKLLVTASMMVLCADGKIEESEMSFLVGVANALSMSKAQFEEILSKFLKESPEAEPA